jgi:sterol 3beta-glucosyltransferase
VSVAIEAIYRDLEYARSLTLKRKGTFVPPHEEGQDPEKAVRRRSFSLFQSFPNTPERPSTRSSNGSVTGAVSEDWSVISDQEDHRSSSSRQSEQSPPAKRRSLTAAMLSVLPDTFSAGSPRVRQISIN